MEPIGGDVVKVPVEFPPSMTLAERFMEFSRWPTSAKTALMSGSILPFHLLALPLAHFALQEVGVIDVAMLDRFQAAWCSWVTVTFLVSAPFARAGKEAQWTGFLFGLPYIAFVVWLAHLFGSASTGLTAIFPVIILATTYFFVERIALVSLLFGLSAYALVVVLELRGVLPYAPILIERTVDAQLKLIWFAVGAYAVFSYLLFNFALSTFIIRTRELQTRRLTEAQKLIRRYVPSQVADRIISGPQDSVDTRERRKLTIFCSDLVGFTDISEELEPEDLSRVLNEYFAEMTAIAQKHGGTVDELTGDAILIFFGAPNATDDKDHALRAVRMALEMQQAMPGLNAKWRSAGITESLQVRMGIDTGMVTIGNFGSPDRMKYAALGKHVNLAARLESQCEPGKVLISHATWLLVQDQIRCEPKGDMRFKGISKPVMTYELAPQGSQRR